MSDCKRCATKRELLRSISVPRAAIALCWECEVFELLRLAIAEVERLRTELANGRVAYAEAVARSVTATSELAMASAASREIALLRRVAELASVPELWSTWAANPERELSVALDELARHDAETAKGKG